MAKKSKLSDHYPLSHYWAPPVTTIEGGVGEPWGCLATSFEFDAGFFEAELLPRFLGLKFDHTENESSFLVEREEVLAIARVAVLVDHTRLDSSQSTLRWDQVPIQVPGGIQHTKITILAWEHLIRVIIGSANLTRAGYRRNREMFGALDFWNDSTATPIRPLREVLDLVAVMVGWSRSSEAAANRARGLVDRLRRTVRGWNQAPIDFTPRERPRVALAITRPRAERLPARSTLDEIRQLWGNRQATSITVVSPFTAIESNTSTGDVVVNKLDEIPKTRSCQGWLVVPELPKTPVDDRTRLPVPQVFGDSWKKLFVGRGGAYVLALPLCVEGKEDRNRNLHSKCIVLESDDDDVALLMVGSSNFTPRGMGIGVYNLEANLVFQDIASAKRNGLRLIDRLELPRGWDEALDCDDVVWQSPSDVPEDEPDPSSFLPRYFSWATYSQLTGEIKVGIDPTCPQPEAWSVRLPGSDAEMPSVFTHSLERTDAATQVLSRILPDAMRGVNIVALLVSWQDITGELRQAKLGVTIEGEDHLLPPESFQKLSAEAIIDCLISGKTPAQWFDIKFGVSKAASSAVSATDSLHSVDTSSFLLYRVRRFGRALNGMSHRIVRTIRHPDAIRYRLLKDPFGPVHLAQSIARTNEDEGGGWCAALDDEHRLFLLTEVLLTVVHVQTQVARMTKGTQRQTIHDVFGLACQQLLLLADAIAPQDRVPDNLREYFNRVQLLTKSMSGEPAEAQYVD